MTGLRPIAGCEKAPSHDHVPNTTAIIMLGLGLVSYVSRKRSDRSDEASAVSLLPGDIRYESPSGNLLFHFPIVTSIVLSIILSLVLYFFR
jgi:Protein of unknown function (DUF2905)